jgi:SAM-dependent methyltransferase
MSGSKLVDRLRAEARRHPWCREVYRAARRTVLLGTRTPAQPTASTSGTFALEAPKGDSLRGIEPISGWYMAHGKEAVTYTLQVTVDGNPTATLSRGYRSDVAAAYPTNPLAVRSGFFGDVVLRGADSAKREVTVGIDRVDAECRTNLFAKSFVFEGSEVAFHPRPTTFSLENLLQDPLTGERVSRDGRGGFTTSTHPVRTVLGTPHFHPPDTQPIIRLSERGTTHPYGEKAQAIIDAADGLTLDFGAGIQSEDRLYPHVVNLDAIHFRNVDVVNSCRRLPFRDETFTAVVSQAVFEHVPEPFFAAAELLRVLKPGGVALIDTAFMQPFHGDPDHYFNMTLPGLREIMRGFEILELGVQPYQNPSLGLLMQVETIAPLLPHGRWRRQAERAAAWLRRQGGALDEALGPVGREVLAAGVYVRARKPRA